MTIYFWNQNQYGLERRNTIALYIASIYGSSSSSCTNYGLGELNSSAQHPWIQSNGKKADLDLGSKNKHYSVSFSISS